MRPNHNLDFLNNQNGAFEAGYPNKQPRSRPAQTSSPRPRGQTKQREPVPRLAHQS